MRKRLFQTLRQRACRLSLANGNAMEPDDRLAIELRNGAEALAESGDIFTVRQRLKKEVRDQDDETER
jgi:hypothetical protein